VQVPRYKLSLCHTPIKPDLLGFPRICVFTCGLRDHVITRFASFLDCECCRITTLCEIGGHGPYGNEGGETNKEKG
jgi:hypothetical protein